MTSCRHSGAQSGDRVGETVCEGHGAGSNTWASVHMTLCSMQAFQSSAKLLLDVLEGKRHPEFT